MILTLVQTVFLPCTEPVPPAYKRALSLLWRPTEFKLDPLSLVYVLYSTYSTIVRHLAIEHINRKVGMIGTLHLIWNGE